MNEEKIAYTLIRSARKTFSLSVNGEGEVVVRVPRGAGKDAVDAFVLQHERWIAKRRAMLAQAKPDLSDGALIKLYGVPYIIARGRGRARLSGGMLFLPEEEREAALTAILKKRARAYMTALVQEYVAAYGFRCAAVRITSARGRWGSCNEKGAISFSFRTAFLSEAQARYIAVHELCHTWQLDHSPAFWQAVGKIMPDYVAVRASLRAASVVMYWL